MTPPKPTPSADHVNRSTEPAPADDLMAWLSRTAPLLASLLAPKRST